MEMNVFEITKDVEIWLTKAEKTDPQLRVRLKGVFAEWKKKGYFVTVFESGEGELYQGTLDLLAYNKRRLTELEVRRAREGKCRVSPGIELVSEALEIRRQL